MKIESRKVLGLDVSKDNVTCHILDGYPSGGLSKYWRKTAGNRPVNYPVFYSHRPTNKRQKLKLVKDFAQWLAQQKPDFACMEPTGNHYSRLWYSVLKSFEIPVLWIGHVELKRYREGKNLPGKGKNDAVDSLAIAAYPHDPEHHLEDGTLNLEKFLKHQPENIDLLREKCQQLEHLARVQNPIVNYARQALSWQFPEMAQSKAAGLFPWLADMPAECTKRCWGFVDRAYRESVSPELGIEISHYLRLHAKWMVDIQNMESTIEAQVEEILLAEEFAPYNEVFDLLGFGIRTRARLLSRIYPFESFLLPNGHLWIEREYREVKKTKREFEKGTATVKVSAGDVKTIKKTRSRDLFKMRVGMGTVLESSGDSWIEKSAGSSICRQSLWLHVLTKVETSRLPNNPVTKELADYCDMLKSQTDANGKPLLNGKHIQGKLMAKTANLMFKEFVKRFVVR